MAKQHTKALLFNLKELLVKPMKLPEGFEPVKAPLPITPMPDQRVIASIPQVNQQNITPTGLTQTETALLSNEEKAIRLRQRGLA